MSEIVYPPDAAAVVDVTRAPYFADPSGQRDCTVALIQALDDILASSRQGMARTMELLNARSEPDYLIPGSFENGRRGGRVFGVFPIDPPPSRILYFPRGTYLVSDTLCYSFADLRNGLGSELNWRIRLVGQSRQNTVIRLKDHSRGFERGMRRPVVSFIRGDGSNIAMSNFCRNLTIDTGRGNPGAVALEFFGNNSCGVSDVTLRSGDGAGDAGLSISRPRATGVMLKNLSIEGFEFGLDLRADDTYIVGENIHLIGQTVRGMRANGPVLCIRGLHSENTVPAVSVRGHETHVQLLDTELTGGRDDAPGVEWLSGQLFLRDVKTGGYRCAVGMKYTPGWGSEPVLDQTQVDEWTSSPACTLSPGQPGKSLKLPRPPEPEFAWEPDFSRWTHPGQHGAIGDGQTDDTAAVQRAMDSGQPVIYFQPGQYRINAPIRIPASVRQINFMFCDFVAGDALRQMRGAGMFTIAADSPEPLLMEDVFSFERNFGHHYFIDHAARRTLVGRNLHLQSCAAYVNSVPGGTVFLESIVTTTGIFCEDYTQPCFVFRGQNAWCRQIDPEYTPDKIINDGSTLHMMGLKTEGQGIAITTEGGGQTELFGALLYFGANDGTPVFENRDSDVSVVAATYGSTSAHLFDVAVRETLTGVTRIASHQAFPSRSRRQYFIPLYAGRKER